MYAEIILPLPLEGTFTYAIPSSLEGKVKRGCRVLVPFGKTKKYIGVCLMVTNHAPQTNFQIKEIEAALDEQPIVTDRQIELWQWIADYYLSPIGEVMNAALPGGLKSESRYKPKTETCLKINPRLMNQRNMQIAIDVLRRSKKQLEMFVCFLQLTNLNQVLQKDQLPEQIAEITREELLNVSHSNTTILRQLIKRDFLIEYEREVGRLNRHNFTELRQPNQLNEQQQDAYNSILLQFMKKNVVLLHGVTSSGKTELYIHLIQRAIQRHEQVLYLMPEIALTFQMQQRLQAVFGDRLGIYHSKYSDEERVEIWRKQLSADPYDVILGARSALFLPFQRLGLVIIDEEHETSFKQQDPAPRYHARSAAIMLAHKMGAKTLLGTATPSAESFFNAQPTFAHDGSEIAAKYGYAQLTQRFKGIQMPEIRVVDLKDLRRRKIMYGAFSPELLQAMKDALAQGEQVILFQNRRGFSQMMECHTCGWTPRCQRCDVSLSFHKTTNQLTCHYCGFTYQKPAQCPACESTDIRFRGIGTEKIEEQLAEYIPDARVARMDLDTTRTRAAHERIINDFANGRTNILIGTQMITKGLDFKKVSVVGIINADSLLNFPDFRAYEHAFMMLSQVAGRAGRHGKRGTVFLQTSQKQLPVIRQIVEGNFPAFYNDLMTERQMFNYPPYSHIIYAYLKHKNPSTVSTAAIMLASMLRQHLGQDRVLGPETPFVSMVKSLSIRRIIIKIDNGISLHRVRALLRQSQQTLLSDKSHPALQLYYDVDPE